MKKTRREILGMGLAAGGLSVLNPKPLLNRFDFALPDEKLDILILGGTSFLGPHQIAYALDRGHKVSTFTRG